MELDPTALFRYGIGLEDMRAALASANANTPKGSINSGSLHYQLYTNDQATRAADYKSLVIAYRNNSAVRLSDVADDLEFRSRTSARREFAGQAGSSGVVFRQPGANIIDAVDSVKAAIPHLLASMPRDIDLLTTMRPLDYDPLQSARHRNDVAGRCRLVTGVVFLFLRSARATLIPAVAVPVSIAGTSPPCMCLDTLSTVYR